MAEVNEQLDKAQVRALVRVALKNDWRGSSNIMAGMKARTSKFPGIIILLGLNIFISLFLGTIFIKVPDLFTGLVFISAGAMVIVAMQVLLEFGNLIVSPDDYAVLTPHPVNSKTFYVAKLLHLLIYVGILSASVSIVPAIFAITKLGSILAGLVTILHILVTNIFAAVLMMNVYTVILKKVDRRRLESVLGYLHMFMMFSVYIGFNILPRIMKDFFTQIDINTMPWTKLLPSYWFAGWIRLIDQGWSTEIFLISLGGVAITFILGRIALSYLSLSYAESLTRTGWSRSIARDRMPRFLKKLWKMYSNREDRALMKLVRANFKHDIQFRLGVMGFVPLLIFYLVFGLMTKGSDILDPLAVVKGAEPMVNILFGIATTIVPFMLIPTMQTSKSFQASWVFFSTPINRYDMVMAIIRIINFIIILPFGVIMAIIFSWLYGNILHGFMHASWLVSVALMSLSYISMFNVKMPFSAEYRPGNNLGTSIAVMLSGMVIFGVPIAIVGSVGYGGYLGWAIIMIVTHALRLAILRIGRQRISRQVESLEFIG